PAVYTLLQDREVLSDQARIERTLGDPEIRRLQIGAELEGFDAFWQRVARRRCSFRIRVVAGRTWNRSRPKARNLRRGEIGFSRRLRRHRRRQNRNTG